MDDVCFSNRPFYTQRTKLGVIYWKGRQRFQVDKVLTTRCLNIILCTIFWFFLKIVKKLAGEVKLLAHFLAHWNAKLKTWHVFDPLAHWHVKMRSWHAFGTWARRAGMARSLANSFKRFKYYFDCNATCKNTNTQS